MYLPLAFTTALNLRMVELTQADTSSSVIESHASVSFSFRTSTDDQDLLQALLSRMDYMPKSIGFRSGEEGGHMSLD